jgi:hypothetical protein
MTDTFVKQRDPKITEISGKIAARLDINALANFLDQFQPTTPVKQKWLEDWGRELGKLLSKKSNE